MVDKEITVLGPVLVPHVLWGGLRLQTALAVLFDLQLRCPQHPALGIPSGQLCI